MKSYFVYILLCSDDSYYIGITNDVFLRENEHNQGLDNKAYTFDKRPVKLVWFQEFLEPEQAISKEKQLKGWSRKKKEALIAGDLDKLPELSKNNKKKRFDPPLVGQARLSVTSNILKKLPYSKPFLFVDELLYVDGDGAKGTYTFEANSDFYKGHFKGNPVTPGVILTECCAQIGLVALGIYLLETSGEPSNSDLKIALSSAEMEFLLPVFPGETVTVTSKKIYFRFQKLKCEVKMHNAAGKLVCSGKIAGMLTSIKNG